MSDFEDYSALEKHFVCSLRRVALVGISASSLLLSVGLLIFTVSSELLLHIRKSREKRLQPEEISVVAMNHDADCRGSPNLCFLATFYRGRNSTRALIPICPNPAVLGLVNRTSNLRPFSSE